MIKYTYLCFMIFLQVISKFAKLLQRQILEDFLCGFQTAFSHQMTDRFLVLSLFVAQHNEVFLHLLISLLDHSVWLESNVLKVIANWLKNWFVLHIACWCCWTSGTRLSNSYPNRRRCTRPRATQWHSSRRLVSISEFQRSNWKLIDFFMNLKNILTPVVSDVLSVY